MAGGLQMDVTMDVKKHQYKGAKTGIGLHNEFSDTLKSVLSFIPCAGQKRNGCQNTNGQKIRMQNGPTNKKWTV
jgi:hypothetical protein